MNSKGQTLGAGSGNWHEACNQHDLASSTIKAVKYHLQMEWHQQDNTSTNEHLYCLHHPSFARQLASCASPANHQMLWDSHTCIGEIQYSQTTQGWMLCFVMTKPPHRRVASMAMRPTELAIVRLRQMAPIILPGQMYQQCGRVAAEADKASILSFAHDTDCSQNPGVPVLRQGPSSQASLTACRTSLHFQGRGCAA